MGTITQWWTVSETAPLVWAIISNVKKKKPIYECVKNPILTWWFLSPSEQMKGIPRVSSPSVPLWSTLCPAGQKDSKQITSLARGSNSVTENF